MAAAAAAAAPRHDGERSGWPGWVERLWASPAAQYYRYMWARSPRLLLATLGVNYALPLVLEAAPWWLSRSKLSRLLRERQNHLTHTLTSAQATRPGSFFAPALAGYAAMSLLYAALLTADQALRARVELAGRLVIKRMVMERVLFSEVGALQRRYLRAFGEEVRADQLEARVFGDVSMTLYLYNSLVPSAFRSAMQFLRQIAALYAGRHEIDAVALLRPTLVSVLGEVAAELRLRLVDERRAEDERRASDRTSRAVSSIVGGLAEIQLNNMQEHQLRKLDAVSAGEIDAREGLLSVASRAYRVFAGRSVLDFCSEIYVVHDVMRRRGINHETYRRTQQDVEYAVRLGRRVYGLVRQAALIFETQGRVMSMLALPSFRDERGSAEALRAARELERVDVGRLRFRYAPGAEPVLDIRPMVPLSLGGAGALSFQRGRSYVVAGRNGSGKSTLVKVLCKLLRGPGDAGTGEDDAAGVADGLLSINGSVPFSSVPRLAFRDRLSYVAQRPFIFPGTVEENVRVGRPDASHVEVVEAARLAGLLDFADDDGAPGQAAAQPGADAAAGAVGASSTHGPAPAKPWEAGRRWWLDTAARCLQAAQDWVVDEESMDWPDFCSDVAPPAASLDEPADPMSRLLSRTVEPEGANISGGFAQSMALARVFLRGDSQLVILDEALGQMDTIKKREVVLPALLRFVRERNMALIVVTHDLASVCPLVDRVVVLDGGRVELSGTHSELLARGGESYRRLLGHSGVLE